VVVPRVRSEKGENNGYNAATDRHRHLRRPGEGWRIDPAKVTRIALQNASSIAGLMLTTEALIVEIPEQEKTPASPRAGGMGGGMY
jgi:chaperonin GroEL